MTLYLFPSPIHSKPNLIHAVLHIPLDRRNPTTNRFCFGQSRSTHQHNPMVMQWRTNNRVYLILLLRQKKPLSLSANRKDYIQLRALLLFISRHSVDRTDLEGQIQSRGPKCVGSHPTYSDQTILVSEHHRPWKFESRRDSNCIGGEQRY